MTDSDELGFDDVTQVTIDHGTTFTASGHRTVARGRDAERYEWFVVSIPGEGTHMYRSLNPPALPDPLPDVGHGPGGSDDNATGRRADDRQAGTQ